MKVSFTVVGEPKAKQRPRVVHNAYGGVKTYTPDQTVAYENLVKISYYDQVGRVKLNPPIRAEITGVFPIPKSTTKKRLKLMLERVVFHTKKIDCDNLAKIILDSLNKIAYDDDSGVSKLEVTKIYGDTPRVDVVLEEIQEVE